MIGDILQPTHLLFVLVVALLVLGPKRLPEAGRALGTVIRDFRMAMSGDEQDHGAMMAPTSVATPPPSMPPAPIGTPSTASTDVIAPWDTETTAQPPADVMAQPPADVTGQPRDEVMAPPPADLMAPPPAEPTAPAPAAEPAATAPAPADLAASEPEAELTGQPTEPAHRVA
jgi:TatA/E family protein of Tat protein translocase